MENDTDEILFLETQLQKLQSLYQVLEQLCTEDLTVSDGLSVSSNEEQRCAFLAAAYGFDGSIFWNTIPPSLDTRPNLSEGLELLRKRMQLIPKIIIKIQNEGSRDELPPELISILSGNSLKIMRYLWNHTTVQFDELHRQIYSSTKTGDDALRRAINRLDDKLSTLETCDLEVVLKNKKVFLRPRTLSGQK